MLDKLIFYNECGAGDIFESREFVKDYMKQFPAKEYWYAHKKHPRILADMPELKYTPIEDFMNCRMPFITKGNSLYVNTWIGRTSKYVLPGAGCTVERLFDMHNEYLNAIDRKHLLKTRYEYIPSIDYSYYDVEGVNNFVDGVQKDRRAVLIDNGKVQSKQAENFDFTPVIIKLSEIFPEIIFVITHKIDTKLPHVVTTDSITRVKNFDLNEISYLSQFCDTLIGRCSGPHTFSQTLDNWLDKNKVLLSFTYSPYGGSFVLDNKHLFMKKIWSKSTKPTDVLGDCIKVIKRSF